MSEPTDRERAREKYPEHDSIRGCAAEIRMYQRDAYAQALVDGEGSTRAEVATMLRVRGEELREAALHGRDDDPEQWRGNMEAARELESFAVRIDGGETYEVQSVELLVRELTSARTIHDEVCADRDALRLHAIGACSVLDRAASTILGAGAMRDTLLAALEETGGPNED